MPPSVLLLSTSFLCTPDSTGAALHVGMSGLVLLKTVHFKEISFLESQSKQNKLKEGDSGKFPCRQETHFARKYFLSAFSVLIL